jgi:hypothetical protein
MTLKSLKRIARFAALGLVVTLPVVAVQGTAEAAYQCKSTVVHAEAHSKRRMKARNAARSFWTDEARSQFGLPWSVWNVANARSMNCSFNGDRHWCIAEAKPCLYVVQ